MVDNNEQIPVTSEEAADWLVRSALPRFLDLLTLTDDAAYFRGLEPFNGYTPTGRLRGWRGANTRLLATEDIVHDMYETLLSVHNRFSKNEPTDAEIHTRSAANFARRVMLPSRLGWTAYRVIVTASRLAKHGAEIAGDDQEEIALAWQDARDALADRARLRPYANAVSAGRSTTDE